uniref:Nucleotide-diphospho-sugar transferase domain-containing protein n=1 Tax=viral metagenome TaxID=1070528 RepID=A0A6C0EST5_9ZZZZ
MNLMMIIYITIAILFVIMLYKYYKIKYNNSVDDFKKELVDIDMYFYSDLYLKNSKNRKVWVHLPFERNSRKWDSFGSRTTTSLNLAYMTLCIKSIIDWCGQTYDIIIYDDTNIPSLLPDTTVDLLKLSGSLLDKYREYCKLQILNEYGGIMIPPSFFMRQNIKNIDNPDIFYVCETMNDTNVSYSNSIISTQLMGSNQNNQELTKYIEVYAKELKEDFGDSNHFAMNYFKQNGIPYIDGKLIGTKDRYNNKICLEDLMSNKKIILDKNHIGLYIPEQLMKRTKYNWYCKLNEEDVLQCQVFISYYMLSE